MKKEYLTELSAAQFLGISLRTLQRLRRTGQGPKHAQLTPKAYTYQSDDLEQWISSKTQKNRKAVL